MRCHCGRWLLGDNADLSVGLYHGLCLSFSELVPIGSYGFSHYSSLMPASLNVIIHISFEILVCQMIQPNLSLSPWRTRSSPAMRNCFSAPIPSLKYWSIP